MDQGMASEAQQAMPADQLMVELCEIDEDEAQELLNWAGGDLIRAEALRRSCRSWDQIGIPLQSDELEHFARKMEGEIYDLLKTHLDVLGPELGMSWEQVERDWEQDPENRMLFVFLNAVEGMTEEDEDDPGALPSPS